MNAILELTHERVDRRHIWIVAVDYHTTHNGTEYVIPQGFRTDLASVPGLFWSFVSPQEIAHGALLHDYLYSTQTVSRKEADRILYQIIREEHEVGPIRARLVWAGVRLFGSGHYRS